jgi:hypothetical protein
VVVSYDHDPFTVTVSSLTNQTYHSFDLSLNFTVAKPASWYSPTVGNLTEFKGSVDHVSYNLDEIIYNVPMPVADTSDSNSSLSFSANLTGLSQGPHSLSVTASGSCVFYQLGLFPTSEYANPVSGVSDTVEFTVDVPPNVAVLSLKDESFNRTDIPLDFTTDQTVSWVGYSLDGNTNVTIAGNATVVRLTEGSHTLRVYARVSTGSEGASDLVSFIVILPPKVSLLSPESVPYNTTDIPLNFTIDKPVSWMAYSIDGQANVTIAGNTTLSNTFAGNHDVTVYVDDSAGNMGSSNSISFAMYPEIPPEPLPAVPIQTINLTVDIALVAMAVAGVILFLKKHIR